MGESRVNCFTPGDRQAPTSLRCVEPSHMGESRMKGPKRSAKSGERTRPVTSRAELVVFGQLGTGELGWRVSWVRY